MKPNNVVKAKDQVISIKVKNSLDEELGVICELMLEKFSGRVAYAVLESGSFLGIGGKLFAIPWKALHYNLAKECFVLDIDKQTLKNAPGFDKSHWPNMSDRNWDNTVCHYYGTTSYWE